MSTPDTNPPLSSATSAFGLAAVVTIVFSTLLTIAQDASPALSRLMTASAGHPWTAHGVLDVALFLGLGTLLWRRGHRCDGIALANAVAIVSFLGGGILTIWFLLV